MRLHSFVAAAALLTASLAAHADTFNFSYTGTGTTASGVFTGDATGQNGVYNITGVTGTRNGVAISGLDDQDAFADQLLYFPGTALPGVLLNPTFVDNYGIAFFVSGVDYDIFGSGARAAVVENDLGPAIDLSVSRTTAVAPVAATPEPSSLVLLGTGLLGALGVARKRFA